jgi:hypothetical protein
LCAMSRDHDGHQAHRHDDTPTRSTYAKWHWVKIRAHRLAASGGAAGVLDVG